MPEPARSFAELGLPAPLLEALAAVGYETPTPIQARTVPPLLAGRDVLAHAPTGTGKTAAFALPILARLEPGRKGVQALVLTPTRELAIQVAEAFTRYASASGRLSVLPVYGGQDYAGQLRALARGVHVVVGTPGRVTDHVKRGTLVLDTLVTVVLDEGDEMLRMGFVDEVEWLLERAPATRQTALFSATMPPPIRRIARGHLRDPEEIGIEERRAAATTIRQRVWTVGGGLGKLDALTRLLDVEPFEAMLVFVRTKSATLELAEKLGARGFAAEAMNGDLPQKERERQVEKLRRGRLDILVATDVVARGLDVERISHVINYDIPYDTEAYVHRIGRTGRAGRTGEAILFVAPRERRLLGAIERATGQRIEPLALPSVAAVNERRVEAFEVGIDEAVAAGELDFLERLVERYAERRELPLTRVAAALARLALGERSLLLEDRAARTKERMRTPRDERRPPSPTASPASRDASSGAPSPEAPSEAPAEASSGKPPFGALSGAPSGATAGATSGTPPARPPRPARAPSPSTAPPLVMERFRVEVGREHGVEVGNIVGAIASEADIRAEFIGRVDVRDDHSIVELPEGLPKFLLKELRRVWVGGRRLGISRLGPADGSRATAGEKRADAAASATATAGTARRSDGAPTGKGGTGGRTGRASDASPRGRRGDAPSGARRGKPSGAPPKGGKARHAPASRKATHRKGSGRGGS